MGTRAVTIIKNYQELPTKHSKNNNEKNLGTSCNPFVSFVDRTERATHRTPAGGLWKISRWLIVGMDPWRGNRRTRLESLNKEFPLRRSTSFEISSHPVKNTRTAPPSPSFTQICWRAASTYNHQPSTWISQTQTANKTEAVLQSILSNKTNHKASISLNPDSKRHYRKHSFKCRSTLLAVDFKENQRTNPKSICSPFHACSDCCVPRLYLRYSESMFAPCVTR